METLLSAHVTHKGADLEKLEVMERQDALFLLRSLRRIPGVKECLVLKTCNRVELYTVTHDWESTRRGLELFVSSLIPFDSSENLVQYLDGDDTIRHLLRVASGLESMIIGEDQIQSQVKGALELSEREGCIGPTLSLVVRKAVSVGKKVRSETRLSKGSVSIGSAAVELAEQKVGGIRGKNVLVIGTGETATLIAHHLVGRGPEAVFISNRTYSRAVELAFALNGKAVRYDSLVEYLSLSDVVLCATSATHMVLEKRHVLPAMERRAGRGRMIIIDVSVPRNVSPDVHEIAGVEVCDIDGLRGVAERNLLKRRREVKEAEKIVAEELRKLRASMDEMAASQAVGLLYRKFEGIKDREVRKAKSRATAGNDLDSVLRDFGDALINRFLADPAESLKNASRNGDGRYSEMVKELFKVGGESNVSIGQDEEAAR